MRALLSPLRMLPLQIPSASFICRQCLRTRPAHTNVSGTSSIASIVRSRTFSTTRSKFAQSSSANAGASKASSFPDVSTKPVAYWLLGSAVSVFGIVVWGGLTRLTESGLSITEWRPVTGSLPPTSEADWEAEFAKYRASPEYARLNPNMSLDEFKKIYFMEWAHRLWGRFIGVSFVLPGIYFIARRRVCKRTALAVVGISGLIAFQGFIGWWMVKSGLRDDLFAPGAHPRVSQYRLAVHLGTAFVCYGWMLLAGVSILRTHRLLAMKPDEAMKSLTRLMEPTNAQFRRLVLGLTALTFITVISGALVAGLDAGLIYNDFPWMGVGLTPPSSELWNKFYSRREDGKDLWWRNMLENPSLVQLDHRILATTTFCAIMALWAFSRTGRVAAAMPRNAKKGMTGVVHLALMQVTLGITTLWWLVPTHLAATHQAGSLALLTGVLILGYRLKAPPAAMALIRKRLAAQKSVVNKA